MAGLKRRVGIVGSRDFFRLYLVDQFVAKLPWDASIISGGARGVDRQAELAGHLFGLSVTSYRPMETDRGLFVIHKWVDGVDQGMTGGHVFSGFASAAFYRNGLIVRASNELVAFWDEVSTGTKDTINKAREAGLRVHIIGIE